MPSIDMSPYYVDNDHHIRQMMDESYRASIPLTQQFWNEADIDTRFKCGDQTLWNQIYGTLPLQNRRQFQFNRIRRIINMVAGYQRRNRKTTIVTPMENSDQQTADDLSGVLQWANNQAGLYELLSDAFEGACTTGFNLLSVWLDYRSDPISGDIRVTNYYHNGVMIDPSFKRKDLTDANFIWVRRWMSKKQVASLMPEREKEIMGLSTQGYRDDKFMFLPENYQYSLKGLVPYDEYYYLDYRDMDTLVDLETGESLEWPGTPQSLKLYLKLHPQLKSVKSQKQTCKMAISVSGKILYNGPNHLGIDRYPFVGVFCYFEPEVPYFSLKMQGIVRSLRDSQYLYNRRKVIELDILESQINSGLKFKESALKDPRDAFISGQGRMLAIRDSASMDDVQMIQAPEIPPTMIELSRLLGEEITQISGVNEELLGSADDDKAGILSLLRQSAGLTTLQIPFDQLDSSQALSGHIFLDIIQNNFTSGKVKKILGREPTDQFDNKAFQKFDCNVEEGMLTTSQKQMQFQQLLQLRELGIDVPARILIETSQIQNKAEFIEALQTQEDEQSQMEQAQNEQQMQQQEILNQSLASKAESDRALAAERLAKIQLDGALNMERMAKSQEDRSNAQLSRIKAAKELMGIDLSQLETILNILKSLQEPVEEIPIPQMPRQLPTPQTQIQQNSALSTIG